MPSSGPLAGSEILCMGQRSVYTATITLCSMFGSVLPRVLSCLFRWALALQEFDLEFRYTKGSSNVVADWLSRAV